MTSSKFFEKGTLILWDLDIVKWKISSRGLCLGLNQDFAEGIGPVLKSWGEAGDASPHRELAFPHRDLA